MTDIKDTKVYYTDITLNGTTYTAHKVYGDNHLEINWFVNGVCVTDEEMIKRLNYALQLRR